MKRLFVGLFLLTAGSCARPGDYPFSTSCEWAEEDHRALILHNRQDREHLRHDALTAEDMAIRYATKTAGPKSPSFVGFTEYRRRMMECMEALFSGVSHNHAIEIALVREHRLRRSVIADAAVMLSFGALYALIAFWVAGAILRDFTHDEYGGIVAVVIVTSVGVSILGVMGGEIWSLTIESLRLGSWHLSYRAERIPWGHYRAELFMSGLVIVWVCAGFRYIKLKGQKPRSS